MPRARPAWPARMLSRLEVPVEVVGRPSRGDGRTPGIGEGGGGGGARVEAAAVVGPDDDDDDDDAVGGGDGDCGEWRDLGVLEVRPMLRLRKDIVDLVVELRIMVERFCWWSRCLILERSNHVTWIYQTAKSTIRLNHGGDDNDDHNNTLFHPPHSLQPSWPQQTPSSSSTPSQSPRSTPPNMTEYHASRPTTYPTIRK